MPGAWSGWAGARPRGPARAARNRPAAAGSPPRPPGRGAPERRGGWPAIGGAAEAREAVPAARAGVAFGRAVSRAGDYFGHTVNVAARVLDEAEPAEVLVTQEGVDAAG